jgi:riboflavin kinase/FMN adenylyltransferase
MDSERRGHGKGRVVGALVVIGNFDGVHRGHQALLRGAEAAARARGLEAKLLTFHPHPAIVLGRTPPPLLTTQPRKRELVHEVAPEVVLCEVRFDAEFAAQTPRQFAERLAREFGAEAVIVGQNFRFGKGRAGGFDDLVALGREVGFDATSEPLHGDLKGPWSSTRAREAIARGDMRDTEATLGRPHMLAGTVIHGKHLGRTIGFPTVNLDGVKEMQPPYGVYAVTVERVLDGVATHLADGAMSVGVNPTTDASDHVKLEVHLLDFSGDLYGAELRVFVVDRLRGEETFPDLPSLQQKISEDVARVRVILGARRP